MTGAGFAGCAAALTLLRHAPELRVRLVHRDKEVDGRIGETLPPTTSVLLRELGLLEGFMRLAQRSSPGTLGVWGADEPDDHPFLFGTAGLGWQLDRERVEVWLREETLRRGAELCSNGSWREESTGSGGQLIDATGRQAVVARHHGAHRQRLDDLVAAVRWFEPGEEPHPDRRSAIEAVQDGWWYTAGLPSGEQVAAFFTDADIAAELELKDSASWDGLCAQSALTRTRLSNAARGTAVSMVSAASQQTFPVVGPRWLAVGDAAAAWDPLSSAGMTKALETGMQGAYALLDEHFGRPGGREKYRRLQEATWPQYLARRAEAYALERRFGTAPFWERRQGGHGPE